MALLPVALPHTTQFLARLLLVGGSGSSMLNRLGPDGENALHLAIRFQDVDLVKFALGQGADPDQRTSFGLTPLHLAAFFGNGDTAKLLLDKGASPNASCMTMPTQRSITNCRFPTPLHVAVAEENYGVVKALVDSAQVDCVDPISFWTPLALAAEYGHAKVVRLLLTKGAKVDGDHRASTSPFLHAVGRGHVDIVQTLFCFGADLNRRDEEGEPAIHSAAAWGFVDIVKLLIGISDGNLDLVGGAGRPAWWYAHIAGHDEIAQMLDDLARRTGSLPARQSMRDIVNDSRKSVNDIGRSKILEDMSIAQQHMYRIQDPDRATSWKERVRFVIQADEQTGCDFEVIEPYRDGQDSQEPFVAVSYCWASQGRRSGRPHMIKVPGVSGGEAVVRTTRAHAELIWRALHFAQSKGIKRVWIDQECIHQEDAEDKKALVGTMHRIYQQATMTVAMLGRHIKSVEDLEAFTMLLSSQNFEQRQSETGYHHTDIMNRRILEDQWFMRSWTTQELFSASFHTGNMVYLIGWEYDFDPSGSYWRKMASTLPKHLPQQTLPRNFILDWSLLTNMTFERAVKQDLVGSLAQLIFSKPDGSFTLSDAGLGQHSWNSKSSRGIFAPLLSLLRAAVLSIKSLALKPFPATVKRPRCDKDYTNHRQHLANEAFGQRHTMSIIEALWALRGKRNSMVSDTLSILANLAGYEYHLDVRKLVETRPTISFSACALALSLANGDVSLLVDDDPFNVPQHGSQSAAPASWLPPQWAVDSASALPRHTLTGKVTGIGNPCVVVRDMLVMRGILWDIQPFKGLLPLQQGIRNCLALSKRGSPDSAALGLEVFKATLRLLFQHDMEQLAGLIVTVAVQDFFTTGWLSPNEYHATMSQLRSWYIGKSKWPSLRLNRSSWGDETLHTSRPSPKWVIEPSQDFTLTSTPLSGKTKELDEIPRNWGSSLLRWIYLTVIRGAPLPVGRCGASGDGENQEMAIFQLTYKESVKAFVPLAELDYSFAKVNVLGQSALGWRKVHGVEDSAISSEETANARDGLAALGAKNPTISKKKLTVQHERELEGVWSPLLCSKGILHRDDQLKSYSLAPLGDSK